MVTIENFIEALKIIATVSIFFIWFVRYDNIKKEFKEYKFPRWFRDVVGVLKISFCVMLHSSDNEIVLIGSSGILILMSGAVITHIRMRNTFRKYIASVTMFLISAIILFDAIK
jgi:putative oxidoreductase|tara:strand:+ start:320 stop:661 length:342 start_codon:yes stop_codon:yes gene_type:complete